MTTWQLVQWGVWTPITWLVCVLVDIAVLRAHDCTFAGVARTGGKGSGDLGVCAGHPWNGQFSVDR